MFRNLLLRLFPDDTDPPRPLGTADGEMAIAALLIRTARTEGRYTADEKSRIEAILGRRQGLSESEAAERRAAAEMIEAEAPDTAHMTRIITERIALADRIDIIAALWEVALSTGDQAPDADMTIQLASGLLGINDIDAANTRRLVTRELGID